MTETNQAELEETARITKELSDSLQHITYLGKERRRMWYQIWQGGLSQQKIADSCGLTRQVVFTEIKRYRAENNVKK